MRSQTRTTSVGLKVRSHSNRNSDRRIPWEQDIYNKVLPHAPLKQEWSMCRTEFWVGVPHGQGWWWRQEWHKGPHMAIDWVYVQILSFLSFSLLLLELCGFPWRDWRPEGRVERTNWLFSKQNKTQQSLFLPQGLFPWKVKSESTWNYLMQKQCHFY